MTFTANTLLYVPFGANIARVNCPIDVFILSGSFFVFRNFFSSLIAGKKGKIAICVIRLLLGLRILLSAYGFTILDRLGVCQLRIELRLPRTYIN